MPKFSERGVTHVLLLIAAFGLIAFLLISSSAPFKDKLFSQLFPKPASYAAGTGIEFADNNGQSISQTVERKVTVRVNYAIPNVTSWPDMRFASAGAVDVDPTLGPLYTYSWGPQFSVDSRSNTTEPHKFARMVGKYDGPPGFVNQDEVNRLYDSEEAGIREILAKEINKGGVWIVGNEPNCCPYIPPELHAYQYKKYHDLIKGLDSTAQITYGGILSFNPDHPIYGFNNLEWYINTFLAQLSQSYWPDIHNIHPYPLEPVSKDSYRQVVNQIRNFRSHLNSLGEKGSKPIWITEFSFVSFQGNQQEVYDQMDIVLPVLKNENLVQRWFWFLGRAAEFQSGSKQALTDKGMFTDTGKYYRMWMLLPTHFRLANSESDLENAKAYPFTPEGAMSAATQNVGQSTTWELSDGAGQKTVYLRFKVNDAWQPVVSTTISYNPPTSSASPAPVSASPSLSVSPTEVSAGGAVTVSWTGSKAALDWVALYSSSTPAGVDNWLDWKWTGNCRRDPKPTDIAASGSCSFTLPANASGPYEFRMFKDNSNTYMGATSNKITVNPPTLTPSPTTVNTGGIVTISWTNSSSGNDWIGLYSTSTTTAGAAGYLDWKYTGSCSRTGGSAAKATGSCSFTMPTKADTYEFRMFTNNTNTQIGSVSPEVTITP